MVPLPLPLANVVHDELPEGDGVRDSDGDAVAVADTDRCFDTVRVMEDVDEEDEVHVVDVLLDSLVDGVVDQVALDEMDDDTIGDGDRDVDPLLLLVRDGDGEKVRDELRDAEIVDILVELEETDKDDDALREGVSGGDTVALGVADSV